MTLYIPRLRRAVSEYFHQPASRDTLQILHVFEEYLQDSRSSDGVYKIFLSQVSKEPHSQVVIGKAVGLLRRYLIRYQPSQEVLQLIGQFCESARESIGPVCPELLQSLRYLRCLVTQVTYAQANISPDDGMSNRMGVPRPVLWHAPSGEVSEPSSSQASGILVGSVVAGRNSQHLVAGSAAGSSCGSESAALKRNQSASGPLPPAYDPYQKGVVSSTGSPLLGADWHVHQSNGSKGGLSNMIGNEMLKFRPPLVWIDGADDGSPLGEEDWLAAHGIQGVSYPEHLWAVAGEQKNEHHVELPRSTSMTGGVSLFQYRCYMDQDPLNLNIDETSAVVEGVCGAKAGGTEEIPIWAEEDGQLWVPVEESLGSVGQVCANLLVKLVIDLWIKLGPAAAYPLVLQMFHQNLLEDDPSTRARAFDMVYNLSIHMEMLMGNGDDLDDVVDPWDEIAAEGRWAPVPGSRSVSPLPSCTTPVSDKIPSSQRPHSLQKDSEKTKQRVGNQDGSSGMGWWLQALLFDLMILITQEGEESEAVWSSAVGCFLHMTTCRGQFLWDKLTEIPLAVVASLLRRCAEFGWSDELYSHLLRLPVHLLYLPDMQQAGTNNSVINGEKFNQFGGMPEILFHFHSCKSSDALGGLVKVLVDYAAKQAECNSDILAPLVSGLVSPGSLDVILSTFRQGPKSVEEVVHKAIQGCVRECILEHGPEQESPLKAPRHRTMYSHSSTSMSETHSSSDSVVEPESIDSWKAVLCVVDSLCLPSGDEFFNLDRLVQQTKTCIENMVHQPDYTDEAWKYLKELLVCDKPLRKAQGLRWLGELLIYQADKVHAVKGDPKSILPEPPSSPWNLPQHNSHPVLPFMCNWLSQRQSGKNLGHEFALLMDQLFSQLFSPQNWGANAKSGSGLATGKKEGVFVRGQTLFETLNVAIEWIKLMPLEERRQPLLCVTDYIFKTVHAPLQMAPPMAGTPLAGQPAFRPFSNSVSGNYILPSPGPNLYGDFLVGTGAVYVRLLRLVPTKLLVELMDELDHVSPAYAMASCMPQIGFHGRPGHKNRGRSSHMNVPWSDTVSDMRAALVLLLLHRLYIDKKGEGKFKGMIKSLLKDSDVRVRYFASRHMLKQVMHEKPAECRSALLQFVAQAQQINDERLVGNPYLQINHILESHITE